MPKTGPLQEKILIVDDSDENRQVLVNILSQRYEIVEVTNGAEAIAYLGKHSHEIFLVLLDLLMPEMDGFAVLERMNLYQWIGDIPVIVVSSEADSATIKKAYSLGITDFIRRPYEPEIILQRIRNTLKLYAKQRRMIHAVAEKYYENEKNSNMMISILSNIVEFRNGESGPHILHIKKISYFLLQQVLKKTGTQDYGEGDILMLCKAAALHDIGKIAIPEEILNKPGKLTDAEFEIMKTHSAVGAKILEDLSVDQSVPLVKAAHDICRWHHERWDGRGYPDGLKGDEIPMHAQVVSLADVYDALTSERCYKRAFTHEEAMQMILNGECGAFNPLLLECLQEVSQELKHLAESPVPEEMVYDPRALLESIENHEDMSLTRDLVHRVAVAQAKVEFLGDHIAEPCFFYCCEPSVIDFSKKAQRRFHLKDTYVNPERDPDVLNIIGLQQAMMVRAKAYSIPKGAGDFSIKVQLNAGGEMRPCILHCRNIWLLDPPNLCGFIGLVRRDLHPEREEPDDESEEMIMLN